MSFFGKETWTKNSPSAKRNTSAATPQLLGTFQNVPKVKGTHHIISNKIRELSTIHPTLTAKANLCMVKIKKLTIGRDIK